MNTTSEPTPKVDTDIRIPASVVMALANNLVNLTDLAGRFAAMEANTLQRLASIEEHVRALEIDDNPRSVPPCGGNRCHQAGLGTVHSSKIYDTCCVNRGEPEPAVMVAYNRGRNGEPVACEAGIRSQLVDIQRGLIPEIHGGNDVNALSRRLAERDHKKKLIDERDAARAEADALAGLLDIVRTRGNQFAFSVWFESGGRGRIDAALAKHAEGKATGAGSA